MLCETHCLGLLQEGEQFQIIYSLHHRVDPMCNTKISSSPKDTFPEAQHLCFLSIHCIVLFMNVHCTFVLKCGVLLEVLK